MNKKIKGKPIAQQILSTVAERVSSLKKQGHPVKLAVILVGDDQPSATYVRKKGEAAQTVGIEFFLHHFPADIDQTTLIAQITAIQEDPMLSGLIVQLPIPDHLYTREVLDAVSPAVDVDCLHSENLSSLEASTAVVLPPTPGAVLSILEHLAVTVRDKHVTILGRGALVGKPMAIIFEHMGSIVSVCHSKTTNTKELCLQADIIVSAVGKKDLVRGDMVKPGAIVIDTGVCFEDGKMYGDVHVQEVLDAGAWVTPTPGGIGPITVARLLLNTVICAEKK
ncbi:MAG: bifunctional 5,10-methylenetetrahydrofolate dehydrogenase/5,10-methenyltetrahydrofolate cyclohydrolase [Candidatus Magasanikbacteria bacterium]|nr:bifunctional 5,10-methylenetetrahydrofolate dehydrogenase/5,10-methenyltetrahydrofolate cyclohydrolase [Candidatus Magasanikbacteria bacterium]NCS71669.1 bifunctional 5,10-methylenetetrahydrofolate dehydrogenase/5,10-methenyltetrahydrofolate cyclohydrolase [Candidatus Magasanikbacteria bacterium]